MLFAFFFHHILLEMFISIIFNKSISDYTKPVPEQELQSTDKKGDPGHCSITESGTETDHQEIDPDLSCKAEDTFVFFTEIKIDHTGQGSQNQKYLSGHYNPVVTLEGIHHCCCQLIQHIGFKVAQKENS